MNSRDRLAALAVALAALSIAFASVFVYDPVTATVAPVSPPVTFSPGSNAGRPDLGNNIIEVSVGTNGTSASVTVHPTYRTTLYKDVLRVGNNDATKSYNVWVKVEAPLTLPPGSIARLCFVSSSRSLTIFPPDYSVDVKCVDLLTAGLKEEVGNLGSGGVWQIDVFIHIPEGVALPSSTTANIALVYTPSTETPP